MVLGAWASSLRLTQHLRAGFLAATQLGALDVRARQSQRRLLPSAHDSSAYRRAAGILRDGGGAWACSKGMHLSESVPQDLMCLRSRCVAVRWIQPSDLYVTIEDCSSPSAEPPVPATVHWRQRAAFTSRTRDRQSSYNPQLCCVRAHSKRGSAISRRPLVDSRSDARRAYPPCHSMHDHRWGQRCSCDCGFGLTSRPLACSCTLPGAILEPSGEWAQIRALSTPTADDLCS